MIARDKLKAFFLLFVCMAGACLYFWMQSRYPDLGSKATLGGAAPMAGLGFFPLYEIKPEFTITEKLFYGTVNWLETNRRGMTFAFILGAFFLSLLPLIEVKRLKGGIKNAFLGLVMGTPLGLCVNCSAPVARAMQASGMSLEASLALLVSSPTMNVVVLTMAFAMFPVSIVLLKIVLVLLFVLVIIPLACRYVFKTEVIRNDALMLAAANKAPAQPVVIPPGWWGALRWSVVAYVRNFIKILVMTGPLMVLAGFLGTAIITFLPWGSLGALNGDLSAGMVFAIMLGVSFIGALLPAPMAFDVAMSAAMLQAGLPMVYTGVLLFTLGAYSIYAFLIVWQAISLRVAGFLMLVTMALGLVMGVGAAMLDAYNIQSAVPQANAENDFDPIIPRNDAVIAYAEIVPAIEKQKMDFTSFEAAKKPEDVTIGRKDFIIANQKHIDAKAGFSRIYGDDLGILQPYRVSYLTGIDIIPRITTSVASGDVHHDGWDDILILGDHEVAPNLILYSNMAGGGFARQEIPAAADVVLVALADVSGDGWLDIVYATYEGENFVIVNDKGDFRAENRKPLNEKLSGTTNSMGFADVNGDGKLDVLLGNWSVGPNFLDYSGSKDVMLLSKGDGYEEKILPGLSGETLATMVWDFNHDGHLDLYIGNDFVMSYISDLILLGDGKGGFGFMGEDMKKMFLGGQSTMSLHAGDINNDLREEYFIGHIAYIGHYIRRMGQIANRQISLSDFCAREGVPEAEMETCRAEMEFKLALARVGNNITDACAGLTDGEHKAMCEVHLAYHKYCSAMGSALMNPVGGSFMASQSRYAKICKRHREAWEENNSKELPEDVRNQHLESANESSTNILLYDGADNGKYTDVAIERGVGFGGWTWNAKFADLDNDGWQDVYVTNGYSTTMSQSTKVFYRNKGDGYFEDATKPFGLEDYSNTSSYSYVDYDFDGDLDIIAVPLDGKVKIFRNDKGSASNAVQFELEDGRTGNKSAIGAKIIIRYQNEGREITQVRSILASGGYKSFDAPVAHFGLGDALGVRKIEVTWPDGRKDEIEGDFKAGGRYRISRNPL